VAGGVGGMVHGKYPKHVVQVQAALVQGRPKLLKDHPAQEQPPKSSVQFGEIQPKCSEVGSTQQSVVKGSVKRSGVQ
jgi:hypothetical protein